jgi:hypothetical protein
MDEMAGVDGFVFPIEFVSRWSAELGFVPLEHLHVAKQDRLSGLLIELLIERCFHYLQIAYDAHHVTLLVAIGPAHRSQIENVATMTAHLRLVVDLSFFGDGSKADTDEKNHRSQSRQQQFTE